MSDSSVCPAPEDLIRLKNDADIPPAVKERLQRHLAQCKNCQKILREGLLQRNKQINLEGQPGPESSGNPPLRPVPSAAKDAPSQANGPADPLAGKSSSDTVKYEASPDPDNPYPFLDPPEAEGEIGWVSNYRVFRVVGTGGMGVVFEAEDKDLRRRVALKVLRSDLGDESYKKRFLQEARLAGQLQSEHIVTIFRVGEWTGPDAKSVPFLAMEFLHGESLESRLIRDGTMSVREALKVARQVAEGLWDAHQANLIHRDIKPANIWLEAHPTTGEFKRVKILDFGLAKPIDQDAALTHHGMVVGTPSYMAPEQIYGLPCDQRTDLFGLGCLLFKCLSGKTPFQGENTMAVLRATVEANSPDLHGASKSLPRDIVKLLDDLLAKDPDRRIPTAREVTRRIDEILGESPNATGYGAKYQAATGASGSAVIGGGGNRGSNRSLAIFLSVAVILIAASYPLLTLLFRTGPALQEVRVGILFSKTGLSATRDASVEKITRLAFKDLSPDGTLLNRRIVLVERDGKSEPQEFAKAAIELYQNEKVLATFGCASPASRRKVGEILKDYHGLHFYPSVSEGVEEIPGLVHLGPVPNQIIDPALEFTLKFPPLKGNRRTVFFVGMDEVGSRVAAHVARMLIEKTFSSTHKMIGADFLPIMEPYEQVQATLAKLKTDPPDIILTTVATPDALIKLSEGLAKAGLHPKNHPVIHFKLDEVILAAAQTRVPGALEGHYAVANYFQSLRSKINTEFLINLQKELGVGVAVSDTMIKAYTGVRLWAEAVKKAGSFDKDRIILALHEGTWESPAGPTDILENDHTQYKMRIAQVKGKELAIVDESKPLVPDIYPHFVPPEKRGRDQQIMAKDRWLTITRRLQTAFSDNEKYSDWENRTRPSPLKIDLDSWWEESK